MAGAGSCNIQSWENQVFTSGFRLAPDLADQWGVIKRGLIDCRLQDKPARFVHQETEGFWPKTHTPNAETAAAKSPFRLDDCSSVLS